MELDSPTGKSGPVPVGSISPQKRNGQIVGYSVYLGVDGEGRRQRRFFRGLKDGERFWDERNKTPLPVGELWDRRTEILYNLERLRRMKTSLTDVVTYFLTHGVRSRDVKLSEVVEEFGSARRSTSKPSTRNAGRFAARWARPP